MSGKKFYIVSGNVNDAPLRDHLFHGYEEEKEFRRAVRSIVDRWGNRVGECIGQRHGFLLLRFHDTPGGKPDEAWLPPYMLKPADEPDYLHESDSSDGTKGELTKAFGF